jgi:diazepam-binding inhibitor (GABA receptor modulator, acyl-CoA-binding protein)
MLDDEFNQAVIDVQNLIVKPTNQDLLKLYGLYKQSLYGSNKEKEPSLFDFTGRLKYKAWANVKSLSKNMAKQDYIKLVDEFKKQYGFNE